MEIAIRKNAADATDLAARMIARELQNNPRLVIGLATGRTMEAVYARLVQMHLAEGLDFSGCRTFNLDEYVGYPGDHRNSYRYYMHQHLFRHVNIDLRNTHLPDGQADNLSLECANYEQLITRCGGIDLQLLGIGLNGHLGFNEPLSGLRSRTRVKILSPVTRQQNAGLFPSPGQVPISAITMGVKTILDSRRCILLATGVEKAGIVARAIEGPMTSMITATALQLHPECAVILDEAAGSQLKELDYYHWVFENQPEWELFRAPASTISQDGFHTLRQPVDQSMLPAVEPVLSDRL